MNKVNYQKTTYFKFLSFDVFTVREIYTEQNYQDIEQDIIMIEDENIKGNKK